jgi:ABC-type Fe3+-hydroxamate transport system, periplasmic component
LRFKAYFVIIFIFFIFNCKKVENINKSDIRIVSLAPSITKTLFRLGLKENIVGVTDFCEYEGMVNTLVKQGRIKRVSGFYNINYENILSVNPTHILGTDSTTYENKIQLENIFKDKKIYWFIHPKDFSGIKRDILKIGSIFNKEYQAKNLVKEMDDLLNDVQNKIKNKISKPKVLVEIFYPPFMTCGKNTFISDIILKAGGI